jgi:hypothetical protein
VPLLLQRRLGYRLRQSQIDCGGCARSSCCLGTGGVRFHACLMVYALVTDVRLAFTMDLPRWIFELSNRMTVPRGA